LAARPWAIVDSGCDSTTLPLEWAAQLGIDYKADCQEVICGTAGGEATQYVYPPGIHAVFKGKKFRLAAQFAPHCPHILLGRQDFFRYFQTVTFDQSKEQLHLRGVKDWGAATEAVIADLKLHPIVVAAST
jgi:hypothetical protein